MLDAQHDGDFLKRYQRLNLGISIDSIHQVGKAQISISNDRVLYWNVAVLCEPPSNQELKAIEAFFAERCRSPMFYLPAQPSLAQFAPQDYKEIYRDSWLFYPHVNTGSIKVNEAASPVRSAPELDIFISTLKNCYVKGDPRNPHGEISIQKAEAVRKNWLDLSPSGVVEYYIIRSSDEPVAVSALISRERLGYVCLVGSLPSFAGRGFGKLATLAALQRSFAKGNADHCLVTEEGTYPDQFYRRLGFEQKLAGAYFGRVNTD